MSDRRNIPEPAPVAAVQPPVPPAERKKVTINPRTLPVGEVAAPSKPSSYSSIFGEGKPRELTLVFYFYLLFQIH
jgi:hypothetical protein